MTPMIISLHFIQGALGKKFNTHESITHWFKEYPFVMQEKEEHPCMAISLSFFNV